MVDSAIQPVSPAGSGTWLRSTGSTRPLASAQRLGRPLDPQDPATARSAATEMISEMFFKPLLAEVRKSARGAAFVDGGQTESIFGEQLDQQLADNVAGKQTGLIDQIAAKLNQTSWRTRLQAAANGTAK